MNDLLYKKLFAHMPTVEYGKALLRPYRDSDVRDFNEYMCEEPVSRYLMWYPHLNLQDTKGYVEFMIRNYKKALPSDWAVVDPATGKVIGNCGFSNVDLRSESAELGYVLSPAFWGKGIMDDAMTGVLHVCFEILEAHRAFLRILDGNGHSRAFAERMGFRCEGLSVSSVFIKGEYQSVWNYAMLEQEYFRSELITRPVRVRPSSRR